MVEAFPWDSAPKYLLRDRDAIYGEAFRRRVAGLHMKEVLTGPRSPWQNPYVERLIGTLRRECFDHVIVLNASHARRILKSYLLHYPATRGCVEKLSHGNVADRPCHRAKLTA